jgi:hypothetical protein
MAKITGSATGSNASRIAVWININETQIDIPNNRSYVVADAYTQVKPGESSSTYDNDAPWTFKINGSTVQTGEGIDYRSSNLNHIGHWAGWITHGSDGKATVTTSVSFSISSSYVSGGSASGSLVLTELWSAITAPTGVNLNTVTATSMKLSFTAATPGVNNPVARYDGYVQYSDNEGSTWSSYTGWGFGSISSGKVIDISSHPGGRLYKAHVTSVGIKGDAHASLDSVMVRKPWTVPGAPTSLSMAMHSADRAIRCSYVKGSAGSDNPITGHEVRYSVSDNGSTWDSETVVSVGSSTLYYDIPSSVLDDYPTGKYFRFRVGSKSEHASTVYSGYVTIQYTSPGTPTNLGFNLNTFETSLRLSWSKGANGTNNAITSQDLQYRTSDDGANWSAETSVALGANDTYYDIPAATIASWSRGKFVQFRVGSGSVYTSTVYSGYSGTVRKNRIPNTPTGQPTTDKFVYTPGETIILSFTPPNPRDPDTGLTGDIVGYEAKMQSPDGADYQNGAIVGTNASGAATTINIPTTGWSPGLRWKFLVRGYDSYGVRGNWSAASEMAMMGIPMKVPIGGVLKTAAEHKVLIGGTLKQVSDVKILVNGVLKNLTV